MHRRIYSLTGITNLVPALMPFALIVIVLTGCAGSISSLGIADSAQGPEARTADEGAEESCPVTEPAWDKPPDDAAVGSSPAHGHYFVNEDHSMWASAWWWGQEEYALHAGEDGTKIGWFRPAGATLEITGRRLDGPSIPLEAHVPCCYPTRFQATGVAFPAAGCWEVAAKAADRSLSFVVWVEP